MWRFLRILETFSSFTTTSLWMPPRNALRYLHAIPFPAYISTSLKMNVDLQKSNNQELQPCELGNISSPIWWGQYHPFVDVATNDVISKLDREGVQSNINACPWCWDFLYFIKSEFQWGSYGLPWRCLRVIEYRKRGFPPPHTKETTKCAGEE